MHVCCHAPLSSVHACVLPRARVEGRVARSLVGAGDKGRRPLLARRACRDAAHAVALPQPEAAPVASACTRAFVREEERAHRYKQQPMQICKYSESRTSISTVSGCGLGTAAESANDTLVSPARSRVLYALAVSLRMVDATAAMPTSTLWLSASFGITQVLSPVFAFLTHTHTHTHQKRQHDGLVSLGSTQDRMQFPAPKQGRARLLSKEPKPVIWAVLRLGPHLHPARRQKCIRRAVVVWRLLADVCGRGSLYLLDVEDLWCGVHVGGRVPLWSLL